MGNFFKDIGKSLKHNHTLKFLADPVKPIEKLVSTAHQDAKAVIGYGGKHLIQNVDNFSNSISNTIPFLVGGAVIVLVLINNR